ncbi:hypothetical protein [Celeribacter baekdonensis]|uniref:hypothetical protein n=1 Tax=Celeribacter baekdonensis TaxID=875171 RepID=UPI003A9519D7
MSWQVRGPRDARDVYPAALRDFSELQSHAWGLAEAAYKARPRLVPAPDALIMLSNPNGQSRRREEIVGAVMRADPNADPNAGTLSHATGLIMSGWAGHGRWSKTPVPPMPTVFRMLRKRL